MSACGPNCNCTIFHQDVLNEVETNLLPNDDLIAVADFFKVMGDFTRIKIMESIKDHELCVCDLGHLLGLTKSAISHQMKTLRKYNIVTSNKKGKMVYYRLNQDFITSMIEGVNTYVGNLK